MKVALTGAAGFLGWHLRAHLRVCGTEVLPVDRNGFAATDTLDAALRTADVVVHAAGMNRGDDAEVERTNEALAGHLVARFEAVGSAPHVIYLSSTQRDRDHAYGRSKRRAGEALAAWGARAGAPVTILILPNVFGEFGRPFYNSVVATFCHQLARGEEPLIEVDRTLELVHAQDVCRTVVNRMEAAVSDMWTGGSETRPVGTACSVSALLERLRAFDADYAHGVFPALTDDFEIDLFNTYRSFLPPERTAHRLTLHADDRGHVYEAIKSHGKGQVFFSTTRPGVTRGNHFHTRKVERFLVVEGRATIRLRRLFSQQVVAIDVDGDEPTAVDIPTFHAHDITNVGDGPLLTAFWANEFFDPERPDTYAEKVVP